MKLEPVNKQFNDATNFIASQIFPLGFERCHRAPNTLQELHTWCGVLGRMAIWDGDYTQTCFADSETWLQFRAWHDWIHQRFDCAFTLADEHKACHIQAGQLMRLYGRGSDVRDMIALTFSEILDRLEYIERHGKPTDNGHKLIADSWANWRDYAQNIIDNQGVTDVDAIKFAERAYEYRAQFGPEVPNGKPPVS